MSSALIAWMNGLRVKAQAIPVATSIFVVFAARKAAWVSAARKSSGAQTHSTPAASARSAPASRSAAVWPIAATEMRSSALTPPPLVPLFLMRP